MFDGQLCALSIGQRFSRLLATTEPQHIDGYPYRMVVCLCDCGTTKLVEASYLVSGRVKSCGCYRRRQNGQSRTPEYRAWQGMMSRCYKPHNKSYKHYGGRGVKVCDRWHDYKNFLDDIGQKPTHLHSLERENNEKNYEPNNVIWATKKHQNNNKRSNVVIEHGGKTQTLSQWCEELNLPYGTIQARLAVGWEPSEALTTKVSSMSPERIVTYNGFTGTVADIAKKLGLDRKLINKRLKHGWSVKDAIEIKDGRSNAIGRVGKRPIKRGVIAIGS